MAHPASALASQIDTETAAVDVVVTLTGRDEIRLHLQVTGGIIAASEMSVIGCRQLLELAEKWRPLLRGPLSEVELPAGQDHAAILLCEAILKAQGRWQYPYHEEELCHCRAVPTRKVDDAIIGGCHKVESIRRATSASTSCGTCRTDIDAILAYRLRK